MKALTGKQASPSVRSKHDMLTSERDLAAGVSSALTASGHVVFNDAAARMTPARLPSGPAISGEIDEPGYPAVVSALEGFAGGSGDIYVHLADVAFCGRVGLTRASLPGHGARRVVLRGVRPHLKAVLRNLGWDCTPGLVLPERDSSIPPRSGSMTCGAVRVSELGLPVARPSGNVNDFREHRAERQSVSVDVRE